MTTTNAQWEDVAVPQGGYISWGPKPGQVITGKVLAFDLTGGTTFDGDPCPQLSLELIEPCDNYADKGATRFTVDAGDLVVINAAQVSIKRAVTAAQPTTGDLIKITYSDLVKTANGSVKEFKIAIARGAGGTSSSKPKTQTKVTTDDELDPPF